MNTVMLEFPRLSRLSGNRVPSGVGRKRDMGQILQQYSIIAELEDAVRNGSSEKRVGTLRQVTDLFLHEGDRLSEDQVQVFDDVLCILIARVESRAKAELSQRLAPLDYAPFEVIQHLARDNDIAVAGDVLANSSRLRTSDLVEIASTKGQDHLFAISGRTNLPEAVTDVIVDRGERKVIRKLANNASAHFSDTKKFDEVSASLAILDNVPTDVMARLIEGPRSDLVLIPCKSAGLSWLAVESILQHRPSKPKIDELTLKIAWKDYGKLSVET